MKRSNLFLAALIMAQALPALKSFLIDQEPMENVKEQFQLKTGLINPELSLYFLDQITSSINRIQKRIASRLERK